MRSRAVSAELDRHFATDGLEAGFDRQLRDAGAHGAEAHDADSTDLRDGHDRRDPTRAPRPVDVCRSAVVAAAARDVVDPRIHAGGVDEHAENHDELR